MKKYIRLFHKYFYIDWKIKEYRLHFYIEMEFGKYGCISQGDKHKNFLHKNHQAECRPDWLKDWEFPQSNAQYK